MFARPHPRHLGMIKSYELIPLETTVLQFFKELQLCETPFASYLFYFASLFFLLLVSRSFRLLLFPRIFESSATSY
jgi:hypothetical protein